MKNVFYLIILCITFTVSSQENDTIKKSIFSKKHELRIDPVKFAIDRRLSLSYEYFYNKRISFGISTTLLTDQYKLEQYQDNNNLLFINNYQIIPFSRFSFALFKSSLFYIEAFSSVNGGKQKRIERLNDGQYAYYDIVEKKYTNVAFGGSLGYKWYFLKSFSLDINAGFGQNIKSETRAIGISRFGLNLGYRF